MKDIILHCILLYSRGMRLSLPYYSYIEVFVRNVVLVGSLYLIFSTIGVFVRNVVVYLIVELLRFT